MLVYVSSIPLIHLAYFTAERCAKLENQNIQIGACRGWNVDNDHIVALPPVEFASGTRCGKKIRVHRKLHDLLVAVIITLFVVQPLCFCLLFRTLDQGKTITAKVVDLCPSCGWTGIDLSRSAFAELAPLDDGVLHVVWEYA